MFNSLLARRTLAERLFTIAYLSTETDIKKRSDELMRMFEWGDPVSGKRSGINCRLNIEYGKGLKRNRPCYGLKIKGQDLLLSELWREMIEAGIQNPSRYTEISDDMWNESRQMIIRVLETLERFEDEEDDPLKHLIENPFAYKLFAGAGINTLVEMFPIISSPILDDFQLLSLVKFGLSKVGHATGIWGIIYEIRYGLSLKVMDEDQPLSMMAWIEKLPNTIIEKYPFLANQDNHLTVWDAVEFATRQAIGCFEQFIKINYKSTYRSLLDSRWQDSRLFDVLLVGVHDEAQVLDGLTKIYPGLEFSELLRFRPAEISRRLGYETALDHAFVKLNPQAATCIIRIAESEG